MTESKRRELQQIITERISDTKEEIASLKELTKPVAPDNAIGRLSRMDAINNKTINENALRENKSKLQKLERALENIDTESFGTCSRCGSEIPFGRLSFMPWTTKCVDCA